MRIKTIERKVEVEMTLTLAECTALDKFLGHGDIPLDSEGKDMTELEVDQVYNFWDAINDVVEYDFTYPEGEDR